jgi:hypothetical protein
LEQALRLARGIAEQTVMLIEAGKDRLRDLVSAL